MKPDFNQMLLKLWQDITRFYGGYFSNDGGYQGGTDADHVPIIPGNNFHPEAKGTDEAMLRDSGLPDVDGE